MKGLVCTFNVIENLLNHRLKLGLFTLNKLSKQTSDLQLLSALLLLGVLGMGAEEFGLWTSPHHITHTSNV